MELDSKANRKVILSVIGLAILLVFGYTLYKEKNISENQIFIEGKIIDFFHVNKARYALKYEYSVNGEKYIGQVGVSPFDCENGKKGCVGENFTVYYSSQNPSYSKIDLGKYEKYKTTVEFFD